MLPNKPWWRTVGAWAARATGLAPHQGCPDYLKQIRVGWESVIKDLNLMGKLKHMLESETEECPWNHDDWEAIRAALVNFLRTVIAATPQGSPMANHSAWSC